MSTQIEETTESATTWAAKPFISDELRPKVASADILLVPSQGCLDRKDLLFFPAGTSDLFDFLKRRAPNATIEAAIEERDYCEVAQHADVAFICDFLATKVFAPMLVSLIMLWVQERHGRRTESMTMKTAITFYDESTGRSIRMSYDGPAAEFEATALAALEQIEQPSHAAPLGQLPAHVEPDRDDQDAP